MVLPYCLHLVVLEYPITAFHDEQLSILGQEQRTVPIGKISRNRNRERSARARSAAISSGVFTGIVDVGSVTVAIGFVTSARPTFACPFALPMRNRSRATPGYFSTAVQKRPGAGPMLPPERPSLLEQAMIPSSRG